MSFLTEAYFVGKSMNLKLVKKSNNVVDVQELNSLSNKLNLPLKFIELMYTRGITN